MLYFIYFQQKKIATENTVCQNLMSQFVASASQSESSSKGSTKNQENPKGVVEQLDALLQECQHLIETVSTDSPILCCDSLLM